MSNGTECAKLATAEYPNGTECAQLATQFPMPRNVYNWPTQCPITQNVQNFWLTHDKHSMAQNVSKLTYKIPQELSTMALAFFKVDSLNSIITALNMPKLAFTKSN